MHQVAHKRIDDVSGFLQGKGFLPHGSSFEFWNRTARRHLRTVGTVEGVVIVGSSARQGGQTTCHSTTGSIAGHS